MLSNILNTRFSCILPIPQNVWCSYNYDAVVSVEQFTILGLDKSRVWSSIHAPRTAVWSVYVRPTRQLKVSIKVVLLNCFNEMRQNGNKQRQLPSPHFQLSVFFRRKLSKLDFDLHFCIMTSVWDFSNPPLYWMIS